MRVTPLLAVLATVLTVGCPTPPDGKENKPPPKVEAPGGLGEPVTKKTPEEPGPEGEGYDTLPEKAPFDPGKPDQGENLNPSTPGHSITTVPPLSVKAEFRAATWNLFRMTVKKAKQRSPFHGRAFTGRTTLTGKTKAEVIFQIMSEFKITIVGLQEVYLAQRIVTDTASPAEKSARTHAEQQAVKALLGKAFKETVPQHPILGKKEIAGYTIVAGKPVYSFPHDPYPDATYPKVFYEWRWREFAPIAYKAPLSVTKSRVSKLGPRSAHLVDVRLTNRPNKRFVFASTHFSPKDREIRKAIKALGAFPQDPQQADSIVALDANSSRFGHLTTYWVKQKELKGLSKVGGKFTKYHRKRVPNTVHVHGTARYRKMDDVIPFGKPRTWAIPGSKVVFPISSYPMRGTSQAEWRLMILLSDHVGVWEDYDVDRN